jgi:hypothetical protein
MCSFVQALVAFVAWFTVVLAPLGRLSFEDRNLPPVKRRGVALLPVFPIFPGVALVPLMVFGPEHWLPLVLAVVHLLLFLFAASDLVYWSVRLRRAKRGSERI